MTIKEVEINGTKCFEVRIHLRSSVKRDVRVQAYRRQVPTLRQAQQIEKELIRDCALELARREGSGLPWVELVDKFELTHRKGVIGNSKRQMHTLWELVAFIRKFTADWNSKICSEINAGDVRRVLQKMADDGYSRSRLRAVKSGINTVFKWGIENGEIVGVRNSPAADIQLGRQHDEKPPQILSLAEVQKLLEHAKEMDHEWYPVWFMALHTGMRSGELFALEWSDIDFETRMITCSKSWNGRLKAIKSTKAGYWRKIPMSQEVEALLKELRLKASPGEKNVLPRINTWKRGEGAKILREFCDGIGVSSVCFHALRACFATHLLNAGVSSPVVKKICGWTDEKVMTRYIRLAGIDVQGATDNLGFVASPTGERKLVNMVDYRKSNK